MTRNIKIEITRKINIENYPNYLKILDENKKINNIYFINHFNNLNFFIVKYIYYIIFIILFTIFLKIYLKK